MKCVLRESNADTVTHPSTNRAPRRLTLIIENNALPIRQTDTVADGGGRKRIGTLTETPIDVPSVV